MILLLETRTQEFKAVEENDILHSNLRCFTNDELECRVCGSGSAEEIKLIAQNLNSWKRNGGNVHSMNAVRQRLNFLRKRMRDYERAGKSKAAALTF